MSKTDPRRSITAQQFEREVGELLAQHFPFGVLSNVPVFNANSKEEYLFANEADHLLHFKQGGIDHLVLVECKNQEITCSKDPKGRAPQRNEQWFVHYPRKKTRSTQASDVRQQLRNQADCIRQLLQLGKASPVQFDCWVVHRRKDCGLLQFDQTGSNGPFFRAYNNRQFEKALPDLLIGAQPVPIHRSPYLSVLQKAIPRPGLPHPPMLDGLDYIARARSSVDRWIFTRFNGWFHSKDGLWGLKGAAGSGKSMLLAYTLAVLATNLRIVYDPATRGHLAIDSTDFMPDGIPPFAQRRLQACAMSDFQLQSLKQQYQFFLQVISDFHAPGTPFSLPVTFARWDGSILDGCNILLLDEAHDLDASGQETVAAWHNAGLAPDGSRHRYLMLALDRQQMIRNRLSDRTPILHGLNFSSRTNILSRCYRCPFPSFMTSIALLFRWYSERGPMVQPSTIQVSRGFFDDFTTFSGGVGVKVEQDAESNLCRLWIRNDSHPANYWCKTVDLFHSARELFQVLRLEGVTKEQVLWLCFDDKLSDLEDRHLALSFEHHRISRENPEAFIDSNVKGLEFPIVVIEGLPAHFDDLQDHAAMWHARRKLYFCSSRATAFLYFVLPETDANQMARTEIGQILNQLQKPRRLSPNDAGETWCMEFRWRPEDVVPLGDYEDGGSLDEAQLASNGAEHAEEALRVENSEAAKTQE